jgi:hypothetical protein
MGITKEIVLGPKEVAVITSVALTTIAKLREVIESVCRI